MKRKIILQYYILSGLLSFCGLSFLSAVYVSFLMKNGLSLVEVNLVNATYFLSLFICEIPTGSFADIFGRKKSFVAACLFLGIAKFIYSYSNTFWWFLVAEVVAAIGYAFQSGAFKAWFVDSMKHYGDEGPHTHRFARCAMICQICGAAGAITGAQLFAQSSTLPWTVGAILLVLLSILAYFIMEEDYFKAKRFSLKRGLISMCITARKSIRYGRKHQAVRFILMITFIQILAHQSLNMYWQPFFREKGVLEVNFGYMFFGMIAAFGIGSFAASRMLVVDRERSFITSSMVVTGILVIVAALVPYFGISLVFFLMHEIPRGFVEPIKDGYLQKRIPSKERATITSFCSMAPHIGGVIGLVLSGLVAQFWGVAGSWILSAVILVAGGLLLARDRVR